MMQEKEVQLAFQELGFTPLEAKVYLFVLKKGRVAPSAIYQTLNLDKSSTYRILDNLVSEHLLSCLGDTYGREYIVTDVELLLAKANEKMQEIGKAQDNLRLFLTSLTKNAGRDYKSHHVQVYEGVDSIQIIWEKRLTSKEKLIREIATSTTLRPYFPAYDEYMNNYIQKRVEKGIFLKGLVPEGDIDPLDTTSTKTMKEVRVLPKSPSGIAAVTTFDTTVAFHNLEGNRLIGIMVEDPMVTHLLNYLFDTIWENAKPSVRYTPNQAYATYSKH